MGGGLFTGIPGTGGWPQPGQQKFGGDTSYGDNCYFPFTECGIALICHWVIIIRQNVVFLNFRECFH